MIIGIRALILLLFADDGNYRRGDYNGSTDDQCDCPAAEPVALIGNAEARVGNRGIARACRAGGFTRGGAFGCRGFVLPP